MQDVLNRTGLGRSTFYAHFDNKFDLLTSSIPKIVLPIAAASDPIPDLQPLFDHVEEMQPVIRPLLNQPLLGEISDAFQSQLADAWREHLHDRGMGERSEMLALVLAGGFMAVCRDWLNHRCAQPSTQVCEQFTRIAIGLIAAESSSARAARA